MTAETPSLHRVLRSLSDRVIAPEWRQAEQRIKSEHSTIQTFLRDPASPAVYGFSTLLGHKDSTSASINDQGSLLESHLVGRRSPLSMDMLRLVACCKVEQLHWGGSGVHPSTYKALLDFCLVNEPQTVYGNWHGSYSSGDVVPGAWFAEEFRARAPDFPKNPGDLITVINGTFYSTAMGITAALSLIEAITSILPVYLGACPDGTWDSFLASTSPDRRPDWTSIRRLSSIEHAAPESSVEPTQRPVSLRDPTPFLRMVDDTLNRCGQTLESRLSAKSANPVFSFDRESDSVSPLSQNSFLDYGLTGTLTNVVQLQFLMAGIWQRLIRHRCEELESTFTGGTAPIQPPKVANGHYEFLRGRFSQLPHAFHGDDSNGIEDLRDLSLATAISSVRMSRDLKYFDVLWNQVSNWRTETDAEVLPSVPRRREEIHSALLNLLGAPGSLDSPRLFDIASSSAEVVSGW